MQKIEKLYIPLSVSNKVEIPAVFDIFVHKSSEDGGIKFSNMKLILNDNKQISNLNK